MKFEIVKNILPIMDCRCSITYVKYSKSINFDTKTTAKKLKGSSDSYMNNKMGKSLLTFISLSSTIFLFVLIYLFISQFLPTTLLIRMSSKLSSLYIYFVVFCMHKKFRIFFCFKLLHTT